MHEMHNRWKFTHAKKTTGIYKVTYSNGMTLDNLPTYYIFYLFIYYIKHVKSFPPQIQLGLLNIFIYT